MKVVTMPTKAKISAAKEGAVIVVQETEGGPLDAVYKVAGNQFYFTGQEDYYTLAEVLESYTPMAMFTLT